MISSNHRSCIYCTEIECIRSCINTDGKMIKFLTWSVECICRLNIVFQEKKSCQVQLVRNWVCFRCPSTEWCFVLDLRSSHSLIDRFRYICFRGRSCFLCLFCCRSLARFDGIDRVRSCIFVEVVLSVMLVVPLCTLIWETFFLEIEISFFLLEGSGVSSRGEAFKSEVLSREGGRPLLSVLVLLRLDEELLNWN